MEKEVYIPDESAITTRLLERFVEEGKIGGPILIHRSLLAYFEERLSRGDDSGVSALSGLRRACDSREVRIEYEGDYAAPHSLGMRGCVREMALSRGGTLLTSDPIMAKMCEAMGIKVLYLAPRGVIQLESLFHRDVMSLHIKEGVTPKVKRGVPGRWFFEEVSSAPTSRDEIEMMIAELMGSVYASYGREAFIEVDKPGATIVQLKDFRIVITRPPLSDGLEVTVVRPIIKKRLEDYSLPPLLLQRLEDKAEGILIAGPPGMGKSTFAQALAEHYRDLKKVVKTIESPRDLQLPMDVTQYSKSASKEGELYDVLLMSRPDYTVFDEMREPEDFNIFIDLRLAGIGMVGVIHATSPIDAIQRIANRADLGVLPSIVDTVIFMHHGRVDKIYVLEMVVKVPTGLRKADLSRPTILVRNFLTGEVEFELYVFGERTFFVPVERRASREEAEIMNNVSRMLRRYVPDFDAKMENGTLRLYIPSEHMGTYVRRAQKKLGRMFRGMNIEVEVVPRRRGEGESDLDEY